MSISIAEQAVQLAVSLLLGAALGICYDVFRTARRRCKRAAAQLFDLAFWACAAVGLFIMGMSLGRGELRLFMIAGAAVGICLYIWALSPVFLRIFGYAAYGLSLIFHYIVFPFAAAARLTKKALINLKNLFSKPKKRFTIMKNNLIEATQEHTRTEVDNIEAQTRKYFY